MAKGAGVEVEFHDEALRMIKECYDELAAKGSIAQGGINPARELAWLPAGAIPLHNPVGSAPGVLLQKGSSVIISLPGVPAELKGIFNSSLQPFLNRTFSGGVSVMRSITVRCNDESVMEPVLRRVVKLHPKVYIKSLANTFDREHDQQVLRREFGCPEIEITLFTTGTDQGEIECLVDTALRDLQEGSHPSALPIESQFKTLFEDGSGVASATKVCFNAASSAAAKPDRKANTYTCQSRITPAIMRTPRRNASTPIVVCVSIRSLRRSRPGREQKLRGELQTHHNTQRRCVGGA